MVTVKELKNTAKKLGLKGYSYLNKAELEKSIKRLSKKKQNKVTTPNKKQTSPKNNKSGSPNIILPSAPRKFKTKKFAGVDEIDTYASMLYLADLFQDECVIIPHSHNNKYKISKNVSFSDITLTWDEKTKTLIEPYNFWEYMNECNNSAKRFIMIPFGFQCKIDRNSHANFLLYDKEQNTLERFEPHGYMPSDSCMPKDIDNFLKNVFKKNLDPNLKYIKPLDYSPRDSFQAIQEGEEKFQRNGYDLAGYCGVWSTYYAILRLKNPDTDRKKVINKALGVLNKRTESYSEFIRDYGEIIRKLSGKLRRSKNPETDFINYIKEINNQK